jgi:hypothetical protein
MAFFGDDVLISGEAPFSGVTDHSERILKAAALRLNRRKTGPAAAPDDRTTSTKSSAWS